MGEKRRRAGAKCSEAYRKWQNALDAIANFGREHPDKPTPSGLLSAANSAENEYNQAAAEWDALSPEE